MHCRRHRGYHSVCTKSQIVLNYQHQTDRELSFVSIPVRKTERPITVRTREVTLAGGGVYNVPLSVYSSVRPKTVKPPDFPAGALF